MSDSESVDNMVKTVIRTFRYTPDTIDNLYLDDLDYHGLEFLYQDAIEHNKTIEKAWQTP